MTIIIEAMIVVGSLSFALGFGFAVLLFLILRNRSVKGGKDETN